MLCAKFELAQWFCRKRFLYFVNIFLLFRDYLLLEKGWGPSFEQTCMPISQGCFGQIKLKLAHSFLGRKFLNFVKVFSLFHNHLSLEKGGALHLNKLESSSPRILCAKFGLNWPSGSREEDENVKSLQTDGLTTDNR